MYRENEGKIDVKCLPPCCSSLQVHTKRANYQTAIWKDALKQNPQTPNPTAFGWKESDGDICIDWCSVNPAPDEVLELLSCNCKKDCKEDTSPCIKYGLCCTDSWHSFDCSNPIDFIDGVDNTESDYYSSDDE